MPHDLAQIALIDLLAAVRAFVEMVRFRNDAASVQCAGDRWTKVRRRRQFRDVWTLVRSDEAVLVYGRLLFIDHAEPMILHRSWRYLLSGHDLGGLHRIVLQDHAS